MIYKTTIILLHIKSKYHELSLSISYQKLNFNYFHNNEFLSIKNKIDNSFQQNTH